MLHRRSVLHRLWGTTLLGSTLVVCACATTPQPPPKMPPKTKAPSASQPATQPATQPAKKSVGTYVHLRVPLFGAAFSTTPLASVDGEPIALGEVVKRLISSGGHGMTDEAAKGEKRTLGRKQYQEILERLIDTRLMLAEARSTGIDKLPDVAEALKIMRRRIMRRMLEAHVTKDLKPDKKIAQSLFEQMVREWKLASVMFESKAKAQRLLGKLKKKGASFEALAKAAVAKGDAHDGGPLDFVTAPKLLPAVLNVIRALKAGDTAPLVRVKQGWVVVRVVDIRHPEDTKTRAKAERQAFNAQRKLQLDAHFKGILSKLVKQNLRLLKRLNFGAKKPGIAALQKDKRVLAQMEGHAPITVGDLASEVVKKYYHGVEAAARENRINRDKLDTFNKLVRSMVVAKNAADVGIPHWPEYKERVKESEIALLVGTFIQRMVAAGISVTDNEGKRYYRTHLADYSLPAFYKLKSIGFLSSAAAKAALASLNKGTEFAWLQKHGNQLASAPNRSLVAEDKTFTAKGLGAKLAKTIVGAKVGENRLFSKDDVHYVVQIKEYVPSKPRPYLKVREPILKTLSVLKVNDQMKAWTKKLRKAYPVRIYMQTIDTGAVPAE